ncbi:F-box protein CPR1 [Linum perenne]
MQYLNQHSKVKLMGSCNGLICYIHFNHTHNDLVVLNPSTGEIHTVYSFISNEKVAEMVGYGFGYDELSNDYKVVWLTRSGSSDVAEIYNIRRKGFSGRIRYPFMRSMGIIEEQRGVFVGGALHWFFFDLSGFFVYVILALDLGSNTFRMLPHPSYDFSYGKMTSMSIGIVASSLSVCSFYKEDGLSKVSIFVMSEYGNGESWNKIYSFQDLVPKSVVPLGSNGDRVLLKLDGCKLVWLDEVEETATLMSLEDGSFDAVFCLESLVKVFPVRDEEEDDEEVKRKEHEKKLAEQEKTWKNSGPSMLDFMSAIDISSIVNMFPEI